jgi:hypothetical protein
MKRSEMEHPAREASLWEQCPQDTETGSQKS